MAGTVPLAATAAGDDTAIARVVFLVDGSAVGVTTSAPFTFSWNSKTVSDGPHTVRSRAYDTAGNSTVSEPVSITTRNADTTPPSAPSGLIATATSAKSVGLKWTAATDNVGVTTYLVFRGRTQVGTSTSTSYSDTGLTQLTQYSYTVYAVDAAGNRGLISNTGTAKTPDGTPPNAPASLTATITSLSQVKLTWTAATDNVGVTGYQLSRGGVQINTSTGLTYSDSGLTPATSYTYAVYAVDAAGNVGPGKAVTVTMPPTAAPAGAGWAGAYFANTSLSGAPIGRLDPTINFSWGSGSPTTGIGSDNFSVRWTGQLTPAKTGTYTFYTQADGGVRLYINDKLVINHWTAGANNQSTTFALTAGVAANVRLEYFDTTGTATAQLLWSGPSIAKAIIPSSVMNSVSAGLTATYFSGTSLTTTAVVRLDNTVNFSWGTGSPDSRVPVDNFSARWTGSFKPVDTATYTFYTDVAGGVRLWINGQQLVNNWTLHSLATNSGKITLTGGTSYDITMEYQVGTQSAVAKLSWSASFAKSIVPQSVLGDRPKAVTPVPVNPPGAPSGLVATPGDGRVNLSWVAPPPDSSAPVTDYVVQVPPDGHKCVDAG